MTVIFVTLMIFSAYAIWNTGAWTDDSPRLQDLLAMTLLMLMAILLAFIFSPFTDLTPISYPDTFA